jgi:hypothetical protein
MHDPYNKDNIKNKKLITDNIFYARSLIYKYIMYILITILLLVIITFIFNIETSVLKIVSNSTKQYENHHFCLDFYFIQSLDI